MFRYKQKVKGKGQKFPLFLEVNSWLQYLFKSLSIGLIFTTSVLPARATSTTLSNGPEVLREGVFSLKIDTLHL